jgi:hypothetical protein
MRFSKCCRRCGPKFAPNISRGSTQTGAHWGAWIDGHHRVRALHRLGEARFFAYVIEEEDADWRRSCENCYPTGGC